MATTALTTLMAEITADVTAEERAEVRTAVDVAIARDVHGLVITTETVVLCCDCFTRQAVSHGMPIIAADAVVLACGHINLI